ncbi:MAG: hypothetical protein Q9210_004319 [Variospora velana]
MAQKKSLHIQTGVHQLYSCRHLRDVPALGEAEGAKCIDSAQDTQSSSILIYDSSQECETIIPSRRGISQPPKHAQIQQAYHPEDPLPLPVKACQTTSRPTASLSPNEPLLRLVPEPYRTIFPFAGRQHTTQSKPGYYAPYCYHIATDSIPSSGDPLRNTLISIVTTTIQGASRPGQSFSATTNQNEGHTVWDSPSA